MRSRCFMASAGLLAAIAGAAPMELTVPDEALQRDDECAVGDEQCALNALQLLRGTRPLPGMDIDVSNQPIDNYE
eukprot:CAMPEP_0176108090 /NCGR_PEP_ID=MMETSP0120_2-20121206/54256_1 /TAXON_ID=160619 /ORGANISM="Kryptoperidinium foliaceum, Strain CCMP 1326" /LENGTH=74 /DNA_ID=CAMNT_0017442245 /DNA_START=88 /DNA_END=309 /DNA_ORIENTATION=+